MVCFVVKASQFVCGYELLTLVARFRAGSKVVELAVRLLIGFEVLAVFERNLTCCADKVFWMIIVPERLDKGLPKPNLFVASAACVLAVVRDVVFFAVKFASLVKEFSLVEVFRANDAGEALDVKIELSLVEPNKLLIRDFAAIVAKRGLLLWRGTRHDCSETSQVFSRSSKKVWRTNSTIALEAHL